MEILYHTFVANLCFFAPSVPPPSLRIRNVPGIKSFFQEYTIFPRKILPVFVTKNGYGDMVIMSIEVYEKLAKAEKSIINGNVSDAIESIKSIRGKYEL